MSKKIVDLNGLDNLAKALDSRAKTAINNEKVRAEAKEAELEQSINDTVAMFGGKSIRYVTQAQYDQLSEAEQNSNTVIYFITDAVDLSHTHTNADILNNIKEVQVTIGNANQSFDGSENISFTLTEIGAAEEGHTHNQYITTASLNGYATKTDLETGLAAKANEIHYHNDLYYEKATVDSELAKKSNTGHNHDDVYYKKSETYDKEEVNGLVGAKADSASLTSLQTTLEGKISTAQTNAVSAASTDASNKDTALKTELTSTITTGLESKSDKDHNHEGLYCTEDEVNELFKDYYKKADTYNKTEMDAKIQTLKTTEIANAKSSAISEAKKYTDEEISALVDSAPDAMNTLKELADAISAHQEVYQAYVNTVSGNIATAKQAAIDTANANAATKDTVLHTTISKEIDDDIAAAKLELQANIDNKSDEGHTHKYAGSSSAGGAATSANKVNSSLSIQLNGGTATTFNGSEAKTINITPEAIGAAAATGHGTHVTWSTTTPKVAGTAAVGTETKVARGDHVHPPQTSVTGNAGTATKLAAAKNLTIGNKSYPFDGSENVSWTLAEIGASAEGHTHKYAGSDSAGGAANSVKTKLTIKFNGGTTEGTNLFTFNGSTAKTLDITPANIGAAASSHGTHVDYATAAPKVADVATVGTSSKVAREDHVHPVQTSVSGNAGTASKLATARTLTIGKKGQSFDGSKDVAWTLAEIGAFPTAGGTMTGNVSYQFSGTGGHAIGLSWKNNDADKTTFGGIGGLASAGTGQSLYMGWGDSPWVAANNFSVSSTNLLYKNKKVYHEGNKPTPADIGAAPASKSVVTKTASSNAITLSKDQYQVASGLTNGDTINLPTVSGTTIVEINLFVNNVSLSSLKLPDNCVWRVDPNLEVGKYFMFTFLWNGTIWLAEAKIYS